MKQQRIHLLLVEDDEMNVHRALSQASEIASITRMSGLDLLKELRGDPRYKRLPTVLTTSDDPNDRDAAFGLGVAGYFVKPAAPSRFRQIMDAMRNYWSAAEFAPSPLEGKL